MAQWHLDELRSSLERLGWRIEAELPGDDIAISGSWRLERGGNSSVLMIDFEGLDGNGVSCLPMNESYGCRVRGTTHGLYFTRCGARNSRTRDAWLKALSSFAKAAGG